MRSKFEKYIREQSGFTSNFEVGCNGQYKSDLMHFMFITWHHQQSKVDDLEHENTLLRNRVSALESKLRVYPKYVQQLKDRNDKMQKKLDTALFEMNQRKLALYEGCDGYKDPVEICQSRGVGIAIKILEQALRGSE